MEYLGDSRRWSWNDRLMVPATSSMGEISWKISSRPETSGTSPRPDACAASTRAFHASLPSSQSKLSTCRPSRLGAWRGSRSFANEMRWLGCLAVLLAAKGGPSLLLRCARFLITHYLTRPGPSSACYDGWIRVTSGMIRRKYSAYRDSHRESRLNVICAGIHDDEAVVGLPVRRGGRSSQLWLAVPQVGREPTTNIRATDDQSLRLQLVADHYVNDGLQVPPPRETGWTIVSRFMDNADKGYPRASRRQVQHVQAVPQRAPPTHIPAPVPRACMWHALRAPPRQSRRNHREFRSSYSPPPSDLKTHHTKDQQNRKALSETITIDEAVADLPVRRGGCDSQLWLMVPQVGLEPTTHGL